MPDRRLPGLPPAVRTYWRPVLIGGCFALAIWPFLTILLHFWGDPWAPSGDRALIEIYVRDVFDLERTPLLGPYSRFGWKHPGPLGFWVLAVPYHLLGASSWSLLIATVIVNAGAAVGFLAITLRRGGLSLFLGATCVMVFLVQAMAPKLIIDPWNPFVTVLPLLLYLGAIWSAREGDRWATPLSVFLGTFLVQSHIGYAVVVGASGAWALFPAVRRWWQRRAATEVDDPARPSWRTDRPLRTSLIVTAVILGVSWAPVAVDQTIVSGNITKLVTYFTTSDDPATGLPDAALIVGREIGPDPAWLGNPEPVTTEGSVLPAERDDLRDALVVFAAISAALFLVSWRVRRREGEPDEVLAPASHAQVLALIVLVTGWFSVSRINEVVFDYLIKWWWASAAFVWLAAGYALWAMAQRIGVIRRFGGPVVAALLVLVTFTQARESAALATSALAPENEFGGPVTAITPGILSSLEDLATDGPIFVRSAGGGVGSVADGVRLQLSRAGFVVVIEPEHAAKFGRNRDLTEYPPTETVWVVTGSEVHDWRQRTDIAEVASWSPLPIDEQEELRQRGIQLADELRANGREDLRDALRNGDGLFGAKETPGIDLANLERVEELRSRGRQVAVFVEPFQPQHAT